LQNQHQQQHQHQQQQHLNVLELSSGTSARSNRLACMSRSIARAGVGLVGIGMAAFAK
jgi:hypothetical protein